MFSHISVIATVVFQFNSVLFTALTWDNNYIALRKLVRKAYNAYKMKRCLHYIMA